MTYPTVKPWLEYKQIDKDEYEVENSASVEEPVRLPYYLVSFMQKLDGNTDPYEIDPSIDKKTVGSFLHFLSKQGFLREKVRNRDLGRFAFPIIKFDAVPKYSKLSVIFNRCLLFFWLPSLIIGIVLGVETFDSLDTSGNIDLFGIIFGLLVGIVLHEAGHTVAAKAYMAPVYEVGVKVGILPTAYTFIEETGIKSRLKKAQIYGAGAETNFLFAGILFISAFLIQHDALRAFVFYAALENLLLGIINLCFFFPLDGFKITSVLLGADDMLWSMILVITKPGTWKKQLDRGASGLARMLCVVFMQLAQSVAVIYILYNAAVILS